MRLTQFFPAAPTLGLPGSPGLFGPDSAAWRIGRERVLLLGGPAALLLQVAHPLVAAGVVQHSDFTADPLRRLRGTLDAVLTVTFGDGEQVRTMARRVAGRHRDVQGELAEATGQHAAGATYRGSDPVLALWVLSTLAWSAVEATAAFHRPLAEAERDDYWRDMVRFGRMFGVARSGVPATYRALSEHVSLQAADVLAVGTTARRLAEQVLAPDPPILPRGLRSAPAVLAAGLLPPALREAYELPWGRAEQAAFGAGRMTVRAALPVLPSALRYWPHYRVARRRLALATTPSSP